MKNILVMTGLALAAAISVAAAQAVPSPQQPSAPGTETVPASVGLADLEAVTFSCPKAALNAAARRAASVPSQGTYQFSYFTIISDSHHSAFEVRFKSNYPGEQDLKYCVEIYCQQGWDPATTKATITLMSNAPRRAGTAAHDATACHMPVPANRGVKK